MLRVSPFIVPACHIAVALLALAGPVVAPAQEAAPDATRHDCIIEPYRVLEVGSAAVGVLQEVRVDRSDRVEAGQVLAVLESGVEAATVDLARLRASIDTEVQARQVTYELNRSNKARSDRLHATRAIAVQARDEVAHDARLSALRLRQAREEKRLAELELARARHSLARRTIRSPIAGVVMQRHKSPGERVEDQPIVRIAQLDPLRVEVVLPVELYGAVRTGMRARVMPQYAPGGELEARVTAIDAVMDAASSTFGVRLSMPNPEHRVPGGLRCELEFLPDPAVAEQPVPPAPAAAVEARAKATVEPADGPQAGVPTGAKLPSPPTAVEPRPAVPASPTEAPRQHQARGEAAADMACRRLGVIDDEKQAGRLRRRFEQHGLVARVEQRRESTTVGYMVAVDASDAGRGAKAIQSDLRRAGVTDFLALPRSPGRISVGYYRGPESAKIRARLIKELGFPARVHPRTRETTRYLLEITGPRGELEDTAIAPVLASVELDSLVPGACGGMVTAQR